MFSSWFRLNCFHVCCLGVAACMQVLPRNRKKLPLAEAFATSSNLADIRGSQT